MVQLAGKYQVVESHNFKELLVRTGIPEDKAQIANDAKTVLEVTVDGKIIKIQSDESLGSHSTKLVLDDEVEEKLPTGTIKSTSKLNGNVLTIESKGQDGGSAGKRIYTFSDSGLEVVYSNSKDDFIAKRVLKRV